MRSNKAEALEKDITAEPIPFSPKPYRIVPDRQGGITPFQKLLLTTAILLAVSSTLLAAWFRSNSPIASGNYSTGVTQCPMGDSAPAK